MTRTVLPLIGFRAGIVLTGMLILPGWAALSLSNLWREWRTLQRWIIAVGLSIAFYPAFFYVMRSGLPFLTLGPYKMGALLLAFAAVTAWRMRRHWREQFALDELEWVAVAVVSMTLFTRFWIIRDHPYPAWSDSLHHALLTRLTAVQGQLPKTMDPYFPILLGQYHLGLYSLTATTQWLAQVPAHTALLWTAQVLNGLCGLGVYLVLDRKAGRVGAIVGAVTAGLLSHQPAFYVNWGRFTQLSSQTILLIAWLVTWEGLKAWRLPWKEHKAEILWHAGLAALLTGAVFLLHFRVAAFYLPLIMMSLTWELWKARQERRLGSLALGGAVVGVLALVIVAPALREAMRVFIRSRSSVSAQTVVTAGELSETIQRYYKFPWSSVPHLVAHVWLIVLAGLGAAVGVLRRNRLTIASVIWMGVLYLLANAYTLGVPLLDLTNLGAVLIMLYLPIGLIFGCATEEFLTLCPEAWQHRAARLVVASVLTAGFFTSHLRVMDIEPRRHFITREDMAAMRWIQNNTPADALFAVNTVFWLPRTPHGTDAGYWIPYFTGRKTTAGAMVLGLAEREYANKFLEMSHAVERLEVDNGALADLEAMGVGYLYVGRRGDFSGPGLDVERLSQASSTRVLYSEGGVSILGIGMTD